MLLIVLSSNNYLLLDLNFINFWSSVAFDHLPNNIWWSLFLNFAFIDPAKSIFISVSDGLSFLSFEFAFIDEFLNRIDFHSKMF